jgi:hypothetical protein
MSESGTALEAELVDEDVTREIAKAVSKRHAIARKYVMWLRRRHPEATPAELIMMLERRYGTSISTAGAVIAGVAIAADVGIALIPVAGPAAAGARSAGQHVAKTAGKEAAKTVTRQAAKVAAKNAAKGAATTGVRRAATFLPAGDQQVQFEMTAIFALAIADIHGMELDEDQARALVYGLSNGRVSQHQIATMATELANASSDGVVGVGHRTAAGSTDWASTLANALPKGAARSLVKTMRTGQLDTVRENLSGKQQTAVGYGVEVLAGGVTRFVFGRDVIAAARTAFAEAPKEFPAHLALRQKATLEADDREAEPNRALAALGGAAKGTGHRIADAASTVGDGVGTGAAAVGTGVGNAVRTVTRPFRKVNVDGDGIPEEPQALTTVNTVGGAIPGAAGAAGASGRSAVGRFRPKKRRERTAVEPGAGSDDAVVK